MTRRMICKDCWPDGIGLELKCMGSFGPCCVCDRDILCGGPIQERQYLALLRVVRFAYSRGLVDGFKQGLAFEDFE